MQDEKQFLKKVDLKIGPGHRETFMNGIDRDEIKAMKRKGYSIARIAAYYGCSSSTIYDILNPAHYRARQARRKKVVKEKVNDDDIFSTFMGTITDIVKGRVQ